MAAALLAGAGLASAQTISFDPGFTSIANGGPFVAFTNGIANIVGGVAGFETFCVELDENLNFTETFDGAVSTAAMQGGIGGGNPDPLSAQTAYLYAGYRNGSLTTTAGATELAQAMQLAIWVLENEIELDGNRYERFDNGNGGGAVVVGAVDSAPLIALVDALIAEANANATGLGNVRVINVTRTNANGTTDHQDVLALIPLPQTVLLASAGLGLVATRRRRAM
jgi:hypothetical protein